MENKLKKFNRDSYFLMFIVLILTLFSLLMVDSATSLNEKLSYVFKKHFIYIMFSWTTALAVSRIDYRKYEKYIYYMVIGAIFLLFAVLFVGIRVKGATRWINLGIVRFQPSEFAKIAIIFFLAHSLSKKDISQIKQFSFGVAPQLAIVLVLIFPLLLQPDFGTSMVIMALLMAMMVISGIKVSHIAGILTIAAISGYLILISAPYRLERLNAFRDPKLHKLNSGYQLYQSVIAFSSGGISGVGLGNSIQKRYYLPEAHTDFIASVIGEELGFIGIVFLIVLYFLLIFFSVKISLKAKTLFGTYTGFGISILLATEIIFNLGVVIGAFPTKGLALPFMSFGGSSMLSNMIMIGILLNISINSSKDRPQVKYKEI